mmetsp:Transcript_18603/g.47885  ORF Transcript_18603/g.47885 Transcript_18603/m.47885 type:complete len:258 (-) Transcript_18603:1476-2249(-)
MMVVNSSVSASALELNSAALKRPSGKPDSWRSFRKSCSSVSPEMSACTLYTVLSVRSTYSCSAYHTGSAASRYGYVPSGKVPCEGIRPALLSLDGRCSSSTCQRAYSSAISLMCPCLGPPMLDTMSNTPPGPMSVARARKLIMSVYRMCGHSILYTGCLVERQRRAAITNGSMHMWQRSACTETWWYVAIACRTYVLASSQSISVSPPRAVGGRYRRSTVRPLSVHHSRMATTLMEGCASTRTDTTYAPTMAPPFCA